MGRSKENEHEHLIGLAMETCGWGIVCEEYLESDFSTERFEYLVQKMKELCDHNQVIPSERHLREALMKVRYFYRQFVRQSNNFDVAPALDCKEKWSDFELQIPEGIRKQVAEHYQKHLLFEQMLRRARLEYSHRDYKQACFACLRLLEIGRSVLHDKSRAIVTLLVLAIQKCNSEDFDESIRAIFRSCSDPVGPSFDDDPQRIFLLDREEKTSPNLSMDSKIRLSTQRHALLSPIRIKALRALEFLLQETICETAKRTGFTSQPTERLRYLLFRLELRLGARILNSSTNYRVYARQSLKTMRLLEESTHSHFTWEMVVRLARSGKNTDSGTPALDRYYLDYACKLAMNLRVGDLKALAILLESASKFCFVYARRRKELASDTLDQARVICQLYFVKPGFKDPVSGKIQESCFESLVQMTRVAIAWRRHDCTDVFLNCLLALPELSEVQMEQLAKLRVKASRE